MRVLTAFEVKMRWRHFQQRTGWILGFRESVVLIVGSVLAMSYGIPAYFWMMPHAEHAFLAWGRFFTDLVGAYS